MAMDNNADLFDWTVRNAVYASILERSVPPSVDETAAALGVNADDVRAAYERLNDRHALFLTPVSHEVRMAHPFSGVPTAFRVEAGDHTYWANCAWDSLGIPATLHVDAQIRRRVVARRLSVGRARRSGVDAGRRVHAISARVLPALG